MYVVLKYNLYVGVAWLMHYVRNLPVMKRSKVRVEVSMLFCTTHVYIPPSSFSKLDSTRPYTVLLFTVVLVY